ncbi:hypothetical protein XENOCAPTIV_024194, partial [Xenoophorus captivus]
PRGSPVSVYLFPGEGSKQSPSVLQREDSELDGLVPTAMEAQPDMILDDDSEGSTDNDDFCILEAPGMGIPVSADFLFMLLLYFFFKVDFSFLKLFLLVKLLQPRDGEPVVTVLCQGPIRVKDSHFSRPRGSSDLLRAPSRFPVPHTRVVLKEISVVWHLYGGKDFGGKPMSIHAQNSNRVRSVPAGVRGSPSRSVSFQHESYPVAVAGQDGEGSLTAGVGPSGEQPLSRQVFIVQELEVRDRLASSQLNKEFRFTSEVPIWLDYHGKHVVIEQLPGLLGGVGPMHSVATAETVYDILSPTPPLNRYAITEGRAPSSRPRRAAQPADLREGVAKAYDTVREGVIDTAQTLCDVASRGHEQKGFPGAVGGVLRQIPPTVVRPLILASEATSNVLGGMRNQIKPDARKEDFLKWRTEDAQE